jgi:Sulfotransferase family
MGKKEIAAAAVALILGWFLLTVAISVKFTHGDGKHLNNRQHALARMQQFRQSMDHPNHHDSRQMPLTSRIRPQRQPLPSTVQLSNAAAAATAAAVPKTNSHSTPVAGGVAAAVPLHPPTTPNRRSTVCVSNTNHHDQCTLTPCTDHDTAADYGFLHYRDATARGHRMAVSGSARAGSGCALSVKYKFLYIHVLKSGGMTIKAFLKNALCGTTAKPCPMGDDVLEIVDCAAAVLHHADYFVFSFVRNPFSRLYSGYSMADSMRSKGMMTRPEFTFSDFVMASTVERRRMSMTSPSHYLPQASFLFDKESHCPVVDFIGRLERFDEDLQIVLSKIASPELQAYYDAKHGDMLHESNTAYGKRKQEKDLGGSLLNAFSTPELVDAAAKEFEEDFRLLGYDPTVVP